MRTFSDIVIKYEVQHNFGKPLGMLTRANLILKLSQYFNDDSEIPVMTLKVKLKECYTVYEMMNIVEQHSGEMNKDRTLDQLATFEVQLNRIIKFARL